MSNSPLDQFAIRPLLPLSLGGLDVSVTNSALCMMIVLSMIAVFVVLPLRHAAIMPSRRQAFAEMLLGFVSTMVKDNIGAKGERFLPLIFSLFFFVLGANILGMFPYSFTVTTHIAVTLALAMLVFLTVTLTGFILHGTHFFSLFLPAGTPIILAPLMIVIELFSFLARPMTLAIRLAANMVAGHIVLKVIASFVMMMGIVWGWVPIPFMVLLTGFEIFVALLQAYIFSILACAYLNDAVNLH